MARRPLIARVAIAISLLMPTITVAQDVTAPALKAAFIYNFVRFTEWPGPLPVSDPFVICVLGNAEVGDALTRVVKGRDVAGQRMIVSIAPTSVPKEACRVLFVSGASASEVVRAVAGLQDSPVLTISDVVGFTEAGGMAQFFFESGQLRFHIKLEAVKRSRLQMSSRLLVLAERYD
jgi:hypothetical protein